MSDSSIIELPCRVLHESPALLVVDKPVGLVVVPARDEPGEQSLWRRLESARGERLWVVHRLDRGTSGVLVFARSAEAHRSLGMAFEQNLPQKRYIAFSRGVPSKIEGSIELALHPARKGKMRPASPGESGALPSRTDWRVLQRWETPVGPIGLVELRPKSGRSHQIRVHLRYLGCPLLVDPLYGRCDRLIASDLGLGCSELLLDRLALHAARIELPFIQDVTGPQGLVVESPMPSDLQSLRNFLDDSAVKAR